jgi:mannosyl-3-phosphoglycerate phosphatase
MGDVGDGRAATTRTATMTKYIIFTDLDGTLLHPRTYSYEVALPALKLAVARGIPVVFCSSKTRLEMLELRANCGNSDPFVFENGGGIFIPESATEFHGGGVTSKDYELIVLGRPYAELREVFLELRSRLGISVTGFGDLTADEIAMLTGLKPRQAALAHQREFDEPFFFGPNETRAEKFLRSIQDRGLRWTQGGRFYHLHGLNDKGRAVRTLKKFFAADSGPTVSIGLGDSLNDLPMLLSVERPVLMQREDGSYDERIRIPHDIDTASRYLPRISPRGGPFLVGCPAP